MNYTRKRNYTYSVSPAFAVTAFSIIVACVYVCQEDQEHIISPAVGISLRLLGSLASKLHPDKMACTAASTASGAAGARGSRSKDAIRKAIRASVWALSEPEIATQSQ